VKRTQTCIFLPMCTLHSLKTHQSSQRLHCNSLLYGVTQANIDRLQRVQNVLARVVAQAPSTISSAHIRRDLHWLPINHCISYKLSLLTWKALYTAEPSYLSELICPYSSANSTFLQHVSSINTNRCYKSLLLTLYFCFHTVNLELYTSTYSLYRQTFNIQASTKVTLLPVCFHCLVTLRQLLMIRFHDFGAI